MRKITIGLIAILASLGMARADTLPRPTASYDGVASIVSGDNRLNATVNASGPRQRWTANLQGTPQTIIVDFNTGLVSLLIPMLQTAMTIDTAQLGGFTLNQIETMPVKAEAREAVGGIDTIRYAVNTQSRQGTFTGHAWVTPGGIMMRIEGNAVSDGKTTPISAVMTELHVRPQNAALLQPPRNANAMALGLLDSAGGKTAVP